MPGLITAERAADVHVRFGEVMASLPTKPPPGKACFPVSTQEGYLFWEDVGAVLVREGREIVVDPAPGVETLTLGTYVEGPALALLLYQRGNLVLHASSVVVAGRVAAFLGESGWGKSTLAAALHLRGHPLLADDVTAVDLGANGPAILPGARQLRLWTDTAAVFEGQLETGPPIHRGLDKRLYPAGRDTPEGPVPLRRVYVLAEGSVPEVEALDPQEAVVQLIRYSYGVRKYEGPAVGAHFLKCVAVAKHADVCRLKRPCDLHRLHELVRLVEEDMNGAAS